LKHEHIERILNYFEQSGISYQNTAGENLHIQMSAEGIDGLAHIEHGQNVEDSSPRFRL